MKLIRKAKDERVVAEINRIYKVGFYFLTAGILADLSAAGAGDKRTERNDRRSGQLGGICCRDAGTALLPSTDGAQRHDG